MWHQSDYGIWKTDASPAEAFIYKLVLNLWLQQR